MLVVCLACSPLAPAATVGYWRFENPSDLGADSGPNGLNLTNNSVAASGNVAVGTVPATGTVNTGAGDFGSARLSVADNNNAAFAFRSFTIEAYIRLDTSGGGSTARIIASQLNTGTMANANAAWQFGITGSSSGLGATRPFLQLSGDGTNLFGFSPEPTVSASAFRITASTSTPKDYYVAATVNFTASSIEAVFYLQNITDSGALISMNGTVTLPADITILPTSLYNSTAPFAIGASYSAGASSRFYDGLIDEVRLSDTALPQSQLLAVPEASSVGLIAASVFLLGIGRRRVR